MFVASFLLHGGLLGGLAFAMVTEAGVPAPSRVDVGMEEIVVLEREIDPIPEMEPPELPSMPAAADLELSADVAPDAGDPRLATDGAPGEPSEGVTSFVGIGGGGLRVRPRRVLAAVGDGGGDGGGDGDGTGIGAVIAAPPAGPSVRARALPDDCEEPDYPARERRLGIEGNVLLLVRIDSLGAVGGVDLLESSGAAALDRAAMAAVLGWRFSPALREGTPVEDSLRLRVRFSLVEAGRLAAER
jgi:TonB family protein